MLLFYKLLNELLYCLEYETKLEEFTKMELEINGVKDRTAKGYAIKDTAVYWLFKEYEGTLRSKDFSWEYLIIQHR